MNNITNNKKEEQCDHEWKIIHISECSFDFNEAICVKCNKRILEGGLMDSNCYIG